MRYLLLIIGWSSILGSFGDGALGLYVLWINLANDQALLSISVNDSIKDYVSLIYWVKKLAFYVLAENIVIRLLSLPALIYFPASIIVSIYIGWCDL